MAAASLTARHRDFSAPFRNSGYASLSRGPVAFDARVSFSAPNSGAYLPQPGGELVLNNTDFQHHNAGTLDLAAGTLRGTGNIGAVDSTTDPKVINRAVLRPGNPTGDLSIRASGGFEQTATGELVITLASTGNSRLVLTSTSATLAGALRVELADGFSPAVDESFTLLTCTSRSGEFTNLALPDLAGGKKFEVLYETTAVKLQVVAAP